MAIWGLRVIRSGVGQKQGRASITKATGYDTVPPVDPDPVNPDPPVEPDSFVNRQTRPTLLNTGHRGALQKWQGSTSTIPGDSWSATQETLTVNNSNVTYSGIDFGTAWVNVNGSQVKFIDCKFKNTKAVPEANFARGLINFANGTLRNGYVGFCTFTNEPLPGNVAATFDGAIQGHDFIMERCNVRGFTDAVGVKVASDNIEGLLRTEILYNFLDELSWWWAPVGGIVHPSDNDTHNDTIQWQGGRGLKVIGNYIGGNVSETVGTFDTVENGNARTNNVDNRKMSLSAIMISTSPRGYEFDGVIEDNWIDRGKMAVNAGDDQLRGNFGIIHRNKFYRNQWLVGWAMGIQSTTVINDGAGTVNKNIWLDDGSEAFRKNG